MRPDQRVKIMPQNPIHGAGRHWADAVDLSCGRLDETNIPPATGIQPSRKRRLDRRQPSLKKNSECALGYKNASTLMAWSNRSGDLFTVGHASLGSELKIILKRF